MQAIIVWYFRVLEQFGLVGVVVLMAMESSVFPIPSELVVPPAAYLHAHGEESGILRILEVIVAGALGSYLGSGITYWVARLAGRPFVLRYGRYFFVSERKLEPAEKWLARHGAMGVFLSRLLPGIRHINAIPAGVARMKFGTFSIMTLAGSALWCTVLAILGYAMGPDMEIVIASRGGTQSPEYREAVRNLTLIIVGLVFGVGLLYMLSIRMQKRAAKLQDAGQEDFPS